MEWKMLRKRGRLDSAKAELSKVFRLIRGSEAGSDACASTSAHEDQRQATNFNLQAHIIARQRIHEIETQKAFAIAAAAHDRWKAGGPV